MFGKSVGLIDGKKAANATYERILFRLWLFFNKFIRPAHIIKNYSTASKSSPINFDHNNFEKHCRPTLGPKFSKISQSVAEVLCSHELEKYETLRNYELGWNVL